MVSFYRATSERKPVEERFRSLGSWFWLKLSRAMLAVQYGQMVTVLNRMPEEHLQNIGLNRCDIPEYARKLVYNEN